MVYDTIHVTIHVSLFRPVDKDSTRIRPPPLLVYLSRVNRDTITSSANKRNK